jgi:hypothetical protein
MEILGVKGETLVKIHVQRCVPLRFASPLGKEAPPKGLRMILTGTPTSRMWTTETVGADGKR